MNKKKLILVAIGSIVVVTIALKSIDLSSKAKSSSAASLDMGIPIELGTVVRDNLIESINYVGTIEPKSSTTLSPTLAGAIKQVYVEEGNTVNQGDVLLKIDDSQLMASFETTQKKLETLKTNYYYLENEIREFYKTNPLIKQFDSAQSNYNYLVNEKENYVKLYGEGAISKTTFDKLSQETNTAYLKLEELKAVIQDSYDSLNHQKDLSNKQIDELNASLNELKVKIDDTFIKAPISGVVKMIEGDVGDLAVIGKPIAAIDDNKQLVIKVNVSERDINKISIGSHAVVKINGFNDAIYTAVSKIIPNVNPSTRIGLIELGPFQNEESAMLFSGNSADVKIIVSDTKDTLMISKNSIKKLNGTDRVYVYKDGVVKEVEIITGNTVGENTEVLSGLNEGDKMATTNLSKLYDNAAVYVFKGEK